MSIYHSHEKLTKPASAKAGLKLKMHACAMAQTKAEQISLLTKFLSSNLEKNLSCICFTDKGGLNTVKTAIKELKSQHRNNDDALPHLSIETIKEPRFFDDILDKLAIELNGRPPGSLAVVMFLSHTPETQAVRQFEATINNSLTEHDLAFLCFYGGGSSELLTGILNNHPSLFGAFGYLSNSSYSSSKTSETNELKTLLANVNQAQELANSPELNEIVQSLVSEGPFFAWLKDEHGRYLYINESMRQFVGYSSDLLGKTDFDWLQAEQASLLQEQESVLLRRGQLQESVILLCDDRENERHLLTYRYIVKDNDNNPYIAGLAIDISDRRRAEEMVRRALIVEHRMSQAIFENAPIGIAKLDTQAVILEANPAFSQQLGLSAASFLGKNILSLFPALPLLAFQDPVEKGLPFHTKNFRMVFDGQLDRPEEYWDLIVWPIKEESGLTRGMILLTMDVSEAIRLRQQREDFMATLAHDLKTPLIGADRILQSVLTGLLGKLEPSQTTVLSMLQQSNKQLLEMVFDLLDVYRYETFETILNLTECDVKNVVTEWVQEVEPLAQSKGMELKLKVGEDLGTMISDVGAIKRVLLNLIDNAMKFSPEQSEIEVSVTRHANQVTFSVKDKGIGLSLEDQDKLFQRFWQGAAGKDYSAGTGLGLYLCRQIVEAHKGKINCNSVPGQGSIFSFSLPTNP